MTQDITSPVGRLVSGHPMEENQAKDNNGQPKHNKAGQPQMETFIGVAFPKGVEQHWNQTGWGSHIWQAGVAGWPNGEYNSPSFAWKVVDGDSQVPNKNGNKPCDREGYPGHWVVFMKQGWPVACYHVGRYEPHQVIQRKEEIKRGDYVRVRFAAVGNAPSQSPGVYLNPALLELSRAGVQIISADAPNANEAFGGSAPQVPANALVDNSVATPPPAATTPPPPAATTPPPPAATTPPPPAAVTPAPDFLDPNARQVRTPDGNVHTVGTLLAAGWTNEQVAALPPAQ